MPSVSTLLEAEPCLQMRSQLTANKNGLTLAEWKTMWNAFVTGAGRAFDPDMTFDKFNEDLYYILTEKTEGDAAARVRSVEPGQGFEAYQRVYIWFSSTCGMALNKRMDSLMVPASPTKPEELAAAIEKWREQLRIVETYGDGYTMSAPFKISALQRLMLNYREKFNVIESMAVRECPTAEAQFEHILKASIEWQPSYA